MFLLFISLNIRKRYMSLTMKKIPGIFSLLILGMVSMNCFSAQFQSISEKFSSQLNMKIVEQTIDETKNLSPENVIPNQNFLNGEVVLLNTSGYFQLAYTGNGIDHMNINLVTLDLGGIIIGDEVGIFDGDICAGAAIIQEKHIKDNSISIPASANDGAENYQNGYIPGHKIILKLYRNNTVYKLYFQAVNNTKDIFEKWESMFALVDFSKSTGQSPLEFETGIKIYPNPFAESVRIEINLNQEQHLSVEIFNMSGQLIRTLHKGIAEKRTILIWDGRNSTGSKVTSGIYLCRSNQTITKITYQSY